MHLWVGHFTSLMISGAHIHRVHFYCHSVIRIRAFPVGFSTCLGQTKDRLHRWMSKVGNWSVITIAFALINVFSNLTTDAIPRVVNNRSPWDREPALTRFEDRFRGMFGCYRRFPFDVWIDLAEKFPLPIEDTLTLAKPTNPLLIVCTWSPICNFELD